MKSKLVMFLAAVAIAFSANSQANEYRGKVKSTETTFICLSFSDYLDALNAALAGSNELFTSYMKKSCMILKPGVELIVVDSSSRWYEIQIKGSDGKFIKAYTHPYGVDKVN